MSCVLTRGGRGGGYKELDEEELEETKRRRREAEEVDLHLLVFRSFIFPYFVMIFLCSCMI